MSKPIHDGAFQASGHFVIQRALIRTESGFETVVSPQRIICEIHKDSGDRSAVAQTVACALNAQVQVQAGGAA